jgi:hypothetical protein
MSNRRRYQTRFFYDAGDPNFPSPSRSGWDNLSFPFKGRSGWDNLSFPFKGKVGMGMGYTVNLSGPYKIPVVSD